MVGSSRGAYTNFFTVKIRHHMRMDVAYGEHQEPRISNGSTVNISADSVVRELDGLRFPLVMQENVPSSSKRVKHKWHSREEGKIDSENDVVIVSFDGGCVSGSESDDSDWSIGWLEPHGTEFLSDGDETRDTDDSFAVLVPCYGCNYGAMVGEDTKSNLLSNFGFFQNSYSDESKKYVENWISSLRHT